MSEFGILKKYEDQYLSWLKEDSCGAGATGDAHSLTLPDLWAGFLVLAAGLPLGIIVLVIEYTKYGKDLLKLPWHSGRSHKTDASHGQDRPTNKK